MFFDQCCSVVHILGIRCLPEGARTFSQASRSFLAYVCTGFRGSRGNAGQNKTYVEKTLRAICYTVYLLTISFLLATYIPSTVYLLLYIHDRHARDFGQTFYQMFGQIFDQGFGPVLHYYWDGKLRCTILPGRRTCSFTFYSSTGTENNRKNNTYETSPAVGIRMRNQQEKQGAHFLKAF